jgi:hypothetical protein
MKKCRQIICCFLLTLQAALAQNFLYQAELDTVPADGFYKITISPRIAGYLKADLSDVRLYDKALREVPYVLQREEPVQYKKLFKEYEIVSKVSKPGAGTSLVLRNAGRSKINNISLVIGNTNATKKAQLSGSNDAREWYSLDDGFIIQPVKSQSATLEVRILDFPLSEYAYYKLDIQDSLSTPINIIKAGYYDTYAENGKYTLIEGLQFIQKDSAALKQTFVHIRLKQPAFIDKLEIAIAAPAYYLRQAEVRVPHTVRDRRKREKTYEKTVAYATLNSSTDNTLLPDSFQAKEFYLLIHNADNIPLQVSGVKAYQLNTYLIASLQKAETYRLKFGQETLPAPVYDLAYFKDKLPLTIPVIQTRAITPVETQTAASAAGTSPFTSKMLIWAAISLVILLLGYLSYKMVKDMKGNL